MPKLTTSPEQTYKNFAYSLGDRGYLPNSQGMWSIYNFATQSFESFDDPEAAWEALTTTGASACPTP